ncbi:MAG TPA: hypothetical protein VEG36_02965 [Burkholderiales bacterium]|nr:hypothetical protein [Burkholderiales bacterium]
MKKPFSRLIAVLISASFAGFATSALAEVTTPSPAYAQQSASSRIDPVVARIEGWFAHPKSEGASKLDPRELNHMYQCETPICRGIR